MTTIHDRPTIATMLTPGRKPRIIKEAITREITRLGRREDALWATARRSPKADIREIAQRAAERLAERRGAIIEARKR